VAQVPAETRLKLFVSGHGGVGIDYITDHTRTVKRTVPELATLLTQALRDRAGNAAQSGRTEVNMLSCLFGRTTDGQASSSPAARLFAALLSAGVFVELVGRTESILAMRDGRYTMPELNFVANVPNYGKHPSFSAPKRPYSKIRWARESGQTVAYIAAYSSDKRMIRSDSPEGQRILWADYAVNCLIKLIERSGKPPEVRIVGERAKALEHIIMLYDTIPSPEQLRARLSGLVDGTGEDDASNFLRHRNPVHAALSTGLPKKAAEIERLLTCYPG